MPGACYAASALDADGHTHTSANVTVYRHANTLGNTWKPAAILGYAYTGGDDTLDSAGDSRALGHEYGAAADAVRL